MTRRVIDVSQSGPFLHQVSHGRRGPGGGGRLAPHDIAAIARKRLNIRRETLRAWRQQFAQQRRSQGVAANATPRQVRGACRQNKDGIYRAMLRGKSRHHARQVGTIVREMRSGGLRPETGKPALQATRRAIERGWCIVADVLDREGQTVLGREVREFVQRMPQPLTEKEW